MKANTKTAPCAARFELFRFVSFFLSFSSLSLLGFDYFSQQIHNQHTYSSISYTSFLLCSAAAVRGRHSSLFSTRALLSSSSYFTLTHIAPPESTIHFFFFFLLSFAGWLLQECSSLPPGARANAVDILSLLREAHRAHTINRQNIQIITTTSTSGAIGTK